MELILLKVSVGVAALEKVFLSGQLFASSVIVLFQRALHGAEMFFAQYTSMYNISLCAFMCVVFFFFFILTRMC